jgi:hypothetical protein
MPASESLGPVTPVDSGTVTVKDSDCGGSESESDAFLSGPGWTWHGEPALSLPARSLFARRPAPRLSSLSPSAGPRRPYPLRVVLLASGRAAPARARRRRRPASALRALTTRALERDGRYPSES